MAARRRRDRLVRRVRGAAPVLGPPALRRLRRAARPALGRRAALLLLRRDEDPAPAGGDHLRRPDPAQLPLDRADARPARRPARGGRQRGRGGARRRDPVLLLQRRPGLHRLRRRGRAARGDALVPDREPDGERDRGRAPVRPLRLPDRGALRRVGPADRDRRGRGARADAPRALRRAVRARGGRTGRRAGRGRDDAELAGADRARARGGARDPRADLAVPRRRDRARRRDPRLGADRLLRPLRRPRQPARRPLRGRARRAALLERRRACCR